MAWSCIFGGSIWGFQSASEITPRPCTDVEDFVWAETVRLELGLESSRLIATWVLVLTSLASEAQQDCLSVLRIWIFESIHTPL